MKQEIIRLDLQGVNCYLGKTDEGFILFDTGGHLTVDKTFSNRREALEKELERAGCKPGNLRLVVLTHGDNDHTANAAHIRDKYNVKIAMHPGDRELVENPDLEMLMKSFHYKSLIYKIVFLLMKKTITKVTLRTLNDFCKFKPDILLGEGDNLAQYGFEAKVLHLPGHTAGSIGILTKEGDLIVGDTFVNAKSPDTAPNADDFKVLEASADRLRKLAVKTVYPGHGEPFEGNRLRN